MRALGLLLAVVWLYGVFIFIRDLLRASVVRSSLVVMWLAAMILLPFLGPVAYLLLRKSRYADYTFSR